MSQCENEEIYSERFMSKLYLRRTVLLRNKTPFGAKISAAKLINQEKCQVDA